MLEIAQSAKNTVWSYNHNNYLLKVEKEEDGFWGTISRNSEVEWSNGMTETVEAARGAVVIKFHRMMGDLSQQFMSVSPELLIHHPSNSEIYKTTDNKDLKDLIRQSRKVDRLLVSSDGVVISGNRRLASTDDLNQEASAASKPPMFPALDVEVKAYSDEVEMLDDLLRMNQYRVKSKIEITREFQLIRNIFKVQAEIRMKQGRNATGESLDSAQQAANVVNQRTGINKSADSLRRDERGLVFVQKIEKELGKNSEYAKSLRELLDTGSTRTVLELEGVDEVDRDLAAEIANRKLGGNKKSVSVIKQQIQEEKRTAIADQQAQIQEEIDNAKSSTLGVTELAATALKYGAKSTDDWHTPDYLKLIFIDFLVGAGNQVDCDPFANLEKDSIPAKVSYNFFDDGFKQEWHGVVLTNIPFSQSTKAVECFDREIRENHTPMGIFIAPCGVLQNKGTQDILIGHKMSVCLYKGRINDFVPGSILLYENVNANSEDSSYTTNIIFVYYGDRHEAFKQEFSRYGQVVRFGNNIDSTTENRIIWEKHPQDGNHDALITANYLNNQIAIKEDDEGCYVPYINDVSTNEQFEEMRNAKAFAIGMINLDSINDVEINTGDVF